MKKKFNISLCYFFISIFMFIFMSCNDLPEVKDSGFCDVNLTYYEYNYDENEPIERHLSFDNLYSGARMWTTPNDMTGDWNEVDERIGYGYYTNDKQYAFLPNSSGFYEFKIKGSNKIWTTGDPLPSGTLNISPNYVVSARDCMVTIRYKVSNGSSIGTNTFTFSVKYGTKLNDYLDGTPKSWSNNTWLPSSNGEYAYTYRGETNYLRNTISGGKKVYYFNLLTSGGSIAGTFTSADQISTNNLFLEASYSSSLVVDIVIKYRVSDGEYGYKEIDLPVGIKKGFNLNSAGLPNQWGDGSWKTDYNGEFSYLSKNLSNGNGVKNIFKKNNSGNYLFTNQANGMSFDSSQAIENQMTLIANYEERIVNIKKEIELSYYYNPSEGASHVNKKYVILVDEGNENKSTILDVESIIPLHERTSDDDRLVMGFINYNDNCKSYYFAKEDGNYKFLDGSNQEYTQNLNFSSFPLGKTTIVPKYVRAGFAPVDLKITNSLSLKFVFVPGSKGNAWPYSQIDASGNTTLNQQLPNYAYTLASDSMDASDDHRVSSMQFMQTVLTQYEVDKIIPLATTLGYRFNSDTLNSLKGMKYKSVQGVAWNYLSRNDAFVMCNFLTALYNQTNGASLTYVYKYTTSPNSQDYLEFKDATLVLNSTAYNITDTGSATGFRIPKVKEWEYVSRIVTDERQLPTNKNKYFILQQSGDRYYFQKAEDSFALSQATGGEDWGVVGSGAALALYNYTSHSYDKTSMRGTVNAIGHADNVSELSDFRQMIQHDGNINYNTRNGAGVYSMHGYMYQLLNTKYNDDDLYCVLKGGYVGNSYMSQANRIGKINAFTVANEADGKEKIAMRVCRYI